MRLAKTGWTVRLASAKRPKLARIVDMITTIWTERANYEVANVDLFSGAAFNWAEWAAYLLRALGKPYVLTLRGGNLASMARKSPQRIARMLAGAGAVVAPSAFLGDVASSFGVDVRRIPNALRVEAYPYRHRVAPRPRLVWLRAFHEIYNPQLAVTVTAQLVTDLEGVALGMIGPEKDGSLSRSMAAATQMGVTTQVCFFGPVPKDQVPNYLADADIFLNTTNIDNTPVSVLEAMACGLCVVSTNIGGIPFLLEHEHDALLVPPNDPAAMTAAVRRILTEPGLAGRLSANARRKAEQFDWSIVLPRWETLFREVANFGVPADA